MPTDRPRGTSPAPGPPRDDAPGPCASCLGLGRPPRAPPFNHPLRPPERPTPPPAPTGTPCPLPHPPSVGPEAPPAAPHPGAEGLRTARGAWWRGRRGAGGSCCEGPAARVTLPGPPLSDPPPPRHSHNATQPQSRILNPPTPDRWAQVASTQTHRPHLGCKNPKCS
ncbi:uncharacterized protein N7487_012344 [Penicillium crustosum]|uniref:uncharacterized protein n=1 Tax=Penicillium crustosum TaxID=36656 RepID=UPI0023990C66|nr:uncharacterized protein N7487_012344 [Penicillium crustosum]KAJ5391013.1 hypothetical protein N7487_012344 [Penicillium crustosum]